jgi:hypothetical protein
MTHDNEADQDGDPAEAALALDLGRLSQDGFMICADLTNRIGLCEVFAERRGFRAMLDRVAERYQVLTASTEDLDSDVRDLLLRRTLIHELGEHFKDDIERARSATTDERMERFFDVVFRQLDPPIERASEDDDGGFFDPTQWKFEEVTIADSDELFLRLFSYAKVMEAVEAGMEEAEMSVIAAAAAAVRLRKDRCATPLPSVPPALVRQLAQG